jgi:mono/diheme cytochrome c family protein
MRKTQAVLINSLSVIATLSFGTYTGLAAGDSAPGQQFFTTHCSACHATEPGVQNLRVGSSR